MYMSLLKAVSGKEAEKSVKGKENLTKGFSGTKETETNKEEAHSEGVNQHYENSQRGLRHSGRFLILKDSTAKNDELSIDLEQLCQ